MTNEERAQRGKKCLLVYEACLALWKIHKAPIMAMVKAERP